MKQIRSFELAERLASQVKDYLHNHADEVWITQVHRLPQAGA